ncbi:Alginate lyase [Planctomycetes bacterium CA13]|uniref:Alginate lyase n=1 Tax=Novipirellula herctigrandis TaxID=2527986 RepID=A0A5C5Z5H9_9BACT|nr:Alginate lyase [Planctomycetes bacterium CA13]
MRAFDPRRLSVECFFAWLLICSFPAHAADVVDRPVRNSFRHPGLLHTSEDLDRIARQVKDEVQPTVDGFAIFAKHAQSQANYRMRGPFSVVHRPGAGNNEFALDANAAYQNALMYCINGNKAHAEKAVEIIDAWSLRLRGIVGHDSHLAAGLYGFKFVSAAELMRWRYDDWSPEKIARAEEMFREAIYPTVKNFAPFANGNWDGACIKTVMAIAVFCDDQAMFDRATQYYLDGEGNGAITHYVINEFGQCQESGRDQQHTQLGLGQLAESCEVAWHQGVDLYTAADNRLLKGFEYTAKYNLGQGVLFEPTIDITGKYHHRFISKEGRHRLRPIWEMAWNHYHPRQRLEMPYTQAVIEKIRPEGAGFHADHVGFGTLLFPKLEQ